MILAKYIKLGENQSGLGYPISDEGDAQSVLLERMNQFEAISLNYDPAIGVTPNYEILPPMQEVVVKFNDSIGIDINQKISIGWMILPASLVIILDILLSKQ